MELLQKIKIYEKKQKSVPNFVINKDKNDWDKIM